MISITLAIIIVTALISVTAFQNESTLRKLIFSPYTVARNNSEWYRFFTSGFIHSGWLHLALNMYVLWMFGGMVETIFEAYFFPAGKFLYVALYVLAIPISETYSYIKHKDNYTYASLGASGAVAAVVFASILFEPMNKLIIFPIPIGIPACIFGPLYLAYSAYMGTQNRDNIGHDAHFWGAVFGFVFPLLFKPELIVRFFGVIMGSIE